MKGYTFSQVIAGIARRDVEYHETYVVLKHKSRGDYRRIGTMRITEKEMWDIVPCLCTSVGDVVTFSTFLDNDYYNWRSQACGTEHTFYRNSSGIQHYSESFDEYGNYEIPFFKKSSDGASDSVDLSENMRRIDRRFASKRSSANYNLSANKHAEWANGRRFQKRIITRAARRMNDAIVNYELSQY